MDCIIVISNHLSFTTNEKYNQKQIFFLMFVILDVVLVTQRCFRFMVWEQDKTLGIKKPANTRSLFTHKL